MESIKTILSRVDYLKIALVSTSIIAAVGIGILKNDSSINPRNEIRGKLYTDIEYAQLKVNIISIIDNRKIKLPTFEEAEIWKELLKKECKNITLNNVTNANLIDKLNEKLRLGCK